MKYKYVLYWQNKEGHCKWRCFATEEKARRFQKSLENNPNYPITAYLAKDV